MGRPAAALTASSRYHLPAIKKHHRAEEDVARSYGLHGNCFITKPVEFDRFVEVIRSVGDFWFSIVTLPEHAQ